jgi:hypothetical protein
MKVSDSLKVKFSHLKAGRKYYSAKDFESKCRI